MSEIVILGFENENGLWVADLEAGTVSAVTADAAADLRKTGKITPQGITFATVA